MGRIVATRWCGGTDNDLADGVQHGSFRADTDAPHADPSCAKRVQCRRPHQAIPLTAHGHTQARALGATLAGHASAVAVSRFMRAQQTAAPYCQRFNLEPQVDADFDEFSLIDAALIEGLDGALRASTSMDDADFDRTMAGALQVSPVEMTFEDGMRIVEYLTSFVVMFRQAESEQPAPNPENLAKLNEEIEELIQARSALGTAWRRLVKVRQPTLREYHALIAGNTASPQ